MFVDNIDFLESFGLSVLKRSNLPVASISELKAIDTSDTTLYTDGMIIMVKSNGLYFFDRGNTNADNGNTIIAPTTGGGRWVSAYTFLGDLAFKNSLTKTDVGLGNVPNVATNDQTPTYTTATTFAALSSGEKLSIAFGKIAKAIVDLGSHIVNKANPHTVTKLQIGLGNVDNTSDLDKPVSTATQTAINNALAGGGAALEAVNTHIANKSNPHNVTASNVGLGNVPNVATNDQTPTYTQAGTLANLTSGEKLSVSFGKMMKAIADLIAHIANKSNPHTVTAAQVGAIPTTYTSTHTSTNDDDLDTILTNAFNAMSDNSTRIIRINFSMQHEFFVSGVSAAVTINRFTGSYGCVSAITHSPRPDVLVRGLFNGSWGTWTNNTASTMANVDTVE